MRCSKIEIDGAVYPLCFSTRVIVALEERGRIEGKDAPAVLAGITGAENVSITEAFWLLAQMIDAGIRYKRLDGVCELEPPGTDELIDRLGPGDLERVFLAINAAVTGGSARNVEAEPPKDRKNTGATPAEG